MSTKNDSTPTAPAEAGDCGHSSSSAGLAYNATDLDLSTEDAYIGLFRQMKEAGIFGSGKTATVKVTIQHYAKADNFARFCRAPARIQFGDYGLILEC